MYVQEIVENRVIQTHAMTGKMDVVEEEADLFLKG